MLSSLRAHRWFDGTTFHDRPVRLRLDGGRITAIEPVAPDAPLTGGELDARDALVLPGLVNTHAHVARAGYFEAEEPPLQIAQVLLNLHGSLRAGVTTVADMGCTMPMLAALRDLTAAEPLVGPRLLGAGPVVTAPGGYPFDWFAPLWRYAEAAVEIGDARAAHQTVDRISRAGMDHIKLAVMHQTLAYQPLPALAPAAAAAAVGEAHQQGRRVYAHAHSNVDYAVALDAGVDALMHSSYEPLTAELVARVADAGVAVCPTLWLYESTCFIEEQRCHERAEFRRHATAGLRRSWHRFAEAMAAARDVFPPGGPGAGLSRELAARAIVIGAANLRLLADAGVPIVFGNDASFGFSMLARPVDELVAMHRAGLDVATCLRAATSVAADLLAQPTLGRIAAGAAADLVVVDRAVETDLTRLDAPRLVVARGHRVRDRPRARDALRLAAAYVEGTARTLVHAGRTYARARRDARARTGAATAR